MLDKLEHPCYEVGMKKKFSPTTRFRAVDGICLYTN